MLLMVARVVPHCERARLLALFALTQTLPSSTDVSTSSVVSSFSSPSLPFTVRTLPASVAVTPCGMATGYLPTRDIATLPLEIGLQKLVSEHLAENLAADIGLARLLIRHSAPRG